MRLDLADLRLFMAIVDAGSIRHSVDLWVYPDRVNWVEITLR